MSGYIRGASGVDVNPRRIAQAVIAFVLLTLAILVVVFAAQAAGENSRHDNLRHRGVPIDATVIGCVGQASGTGITVAGYTCQVTYALDGIQHTGPLAGNAAQLVVGEHVAAVVDPQDPAAPTSAAAATTTDSAWRAYLPAGITAAVLCAALAAAWLWRVRTDR
jgi:hypothetical protein